MIKLLQKIILPLASKDDVEALRSFARLMSLAFPIIFMLLLPWLFGPNLPYWPLAVPIVLMSLHVFYPKGIYYPYYAWMVIASVLGWFNTSLILGLVFYIIITPIGVIMAMLGKLQYKKRVTSKSNWVKKENTDANKDKKRLEEPF
ncbi:SxtJ family membrane protein [Glaciecola sp. SC05]|uniref:SxtJ family membrane protein n=1 Tax=Glaciecola sp. SC05 TaxID=1987355 RepID=UPI0035279AF6